MSTPIWQALPSVPLFQWLARGSLKQNLPQAMRLWVWLRWLYGADSDRVTLPDLFTYADWRDVCFTFSHPSSDVKPSLHDPLCPCTKITAAWLFGSFSLTQTEWEQSDGFSKAQKPVQALKNALRIHGALPPNFPSLLFETRLFGMTGRTLRNDLKVLVDIHWLKQKGQQYYRVNEFPDCPVPGFESGADRNRSGSALDFFTQPDLATIADNLSQTMNGQQRFFVHLEYVIPSRRLDQVDDWQHQLRGIWQQPVISPVLLHYRGAGQPQPSQVVVYPVCLYYYQRGPYLCAYGEVPYLNSQSLNWRNYRLDRIEAMVSLGWDDSQIPTALKKMYQSGTLPTPEAVQTQMDEAWGFDYYQPAQTLLLRFEREWNDRYIHNTLRHSTFRSISYAQAGQLIRQSLQGQTQKTMLHIWRSRSEQDAYYQAVYRQDDPNVRQRIRAWRPRVEVFLPWDLRQRMIWEMAQEGKMYRQDED